MCVDVCVNGAGARGRAGIYFFWYRFGMESIGEGREVMSAGRGIGKGGERFFEVCV